MGLNLVKTTRRLHKRYSLFPQSCLEVVTLKMGSYAADKCYSGDGSIAQSHIDRLSDTKIDTPTNINDHYVFKFLKWFLPIVGVIRFETISNKLNL